MLNISIVLYRPNWQGELLPLLDELMRVQCLNRVYLVDNSPEQSHMDLGAYDKVCYIFNARNLGYGAAHNIAIRESIETSIPFHLVINSDIILRAEYLDTLHAYMQQHDRVGSLQPRIIYPDGTPQYACRLLPTPIDVMGRRFFPWAIYERNRKYELRHTGYNRVMNVPYMCGCFMLMRTAAVAEVGLFDERFFMYPEDIDLTRRLHRSYITMYYPDITIIHNHARSSYKSRKMLWVHIVNMCRYFNKWGWIFDRERWRMNRETLAAYPIQQ